MIKNISPNLLLINSLIYFYHKILNNIIYVYIKFIFTFINIHSKLKLTNISNENCIF